MITYCEICDSPINDDENFDGLCIECYCNLLIDEASDLDVRDYLRYSFEDFMKFTGMNISK